MRARRTPTTDRQDRATRRSAGDPFTARRFWPARPPAQAAPPEPEAAPGDVRPAASRELFDERRLRQSGGPEDTALYTCSCGMAWHADVIASVACPRCGTSQAW
ncbi:MAG TPA: hypothetical protein VK279_09585 [Solirubrobacteraceae bacterium]|nr:hypothetical protein [Solirubrobacteraceae bacterium]